MWAASSTGKVFSPGHGATPLVSIGDQDSEVPHSTGLPEVDFIRTLARQVVEPLPVRDAYPQLHRIGRPNRSLEPGVLAAVAARLVDRVLLCVEDHLFARRGEQIHVEHIGETHEIKQHVRQLLAHACKRLTVEAA